jgi:cytochrome c peroxidase
MHQRFAAARFLFAASLAVLAAACGGGGGSGGGTTTGGTTVVQTTAPGAPTGLAATAGNTTATLTFTAPASNGGSVITAYTATCSANGTNVTASGPGSPITVNGLTNNLAYSCTVTATNAVATSAASNAVSVTPVAPLAAPGIPTIVSATPANASAVIVFTAPASNGGSAITSFTATCVNGNNRPATSGAASPITVLGLTNGLIYSCSVVATNAQGSSASSGALNVTPAPTNPTPAGVAEFTTVDFAAVANYANPTLPAYYDNTLNPLDNTPPNNQINDRAATLGRVLFYDKRLSINDTISCASCHQQAFGFTDPRRFSLGFSGSAFTTAHAMRLGNIRYYGPGSMFWDRRAASVEAQATQPIQNAIEMGWTAAAGGMTALIAKMDATIYYRDLFNFAFGSPAITEARIQQALAQFERAMVSTTSKWDTGYAQVFNVNAPNRGLNADLPNFTAEENRGRTLFINPRNNGGAGCAACHVPPTFSLAANSQSNGLDAGETTIFKSPSLKNLNVTGPYMHDGRFATLTEVVDFYDHGIQLGPALDNRLRQGPNNGQPQNLGLSAADRAALVAFLRTLDDASLNADAKFSNPMKK